MQKNILDKFPPDRQIPHVVSCGFGHIYCRNPLCKTSFYMQWQVNVLKPCLCLVKIYLSILIISFDFCLFSKSLLLFLKKTSFSNKFCWVTNLIANNSPRLHNDFFPIVDKELQPLPRKHPHPTNLQLAGAILLRPSEYPAHPLVPRYRMCCCFCYHHSARQHPGCHQHPTLRLKHQRQQPP